MFVGLYVRLTITETPVFQEALSAERARQSADAAWCFATTPERSSLGIARRLATFVLFYLMTVFALSWGTSRRSATAAQKFLLMQLFGDPVLRADHSALRASGGARTAPDAAVGHRRRSALFGLVMAPLFAAGTTGAVMMMAVGLSLMGLTYGPLGTVISELFPNNRPLHRQFAGVQLCRHLGRIAGAVYRDVAGEELWIAVCRLLSHRLGGPDAARVVCDPGNER